MVLRFYKTNYSFVFIFLLVFALILWVSAFFSQTTTTFSLINSNPLLYFLEPILSIQWLNILLALLLLLIQSLVLNNIISNNGLINQRTYVPALVYISLMSIHPEMLHLSNGLIINVFILMIINTAFKLYDEDSNYEYSYTLGFLTTIACLISITSVFLVIAIISSYIIYRIYNWRVWATTLIGLLTPFLILFSIYYISNNIDFFILHLANQLELITFSLANFPIRNTWFIILLSISFIYLIVKYINFSSDKVIRIRNHSSIVIWLFIWACCSQFMQNNTPILNLTFLFIPLTIFISATLLNLKKQIIAELLFTIILGIIIWLKIIY